MAVYKSQTKKETEKVILKRCKQCNQEKEALYQNPTGSAVFCSKGCFDKFYNFCIEAEKYRI